MQHVFRLLGIPSDIISDLDPQIISQVWKPFCQALDTSVSLSSGFHPQTNGQAERTSQELEAVLHDYQFLFLELSVKVGEVCS